MSNSVNEDLANAGSERRLEKSLSEAVERASAAFFDRVDNLELLHIVDAGLSYAAEQNDENLTVSARCNVSSLHKMRSLCLFHMGEIMKSVKEMDQAVIAARIPDETITSVADQWCLHFCDWLQDNLLWNKQIVVNYFKCKVKAARQLSTLPSAVSGALVLARQSCILARKIWTLEPSLISNDDMIDLLIFYAELCADSGNWTIASKVIDEAFGFGGVTVSLYRMAVRVNLNKVTCGKIPGQTKLKVCDETLHYLNKALSVQPDDEELLSLRSTVSELKGNLIHEEENRKQDEQWSMDDSDWILVTNLKKQHDKQKQAVDQFKASKSAKTKQKLKHVPRKRPEKTVDVDPQTTAQDAKTNEILLELSVGRTPDGNTPSSTTKSSVPKKNKKSTDTGMRYLKSDTIGSQPTSCKTTKKSRKKECKASKDIYTYLIEHFTIRLGCDYCIETTSVSASGNISDEYFVRIRSGTHQCREDRLLVQDQHSSSTSEFSWIHIRPCPSSFKPESGICESFLVGESCHERSRCPFPHSEVEKELWTKYFGHSDKTTGTVGVQRFVSDLRDSALRIRFEVERLCALYDGELKFVCRQCQVCGKGKDVGKRRHSPECENGHLWSDNGTLMFVLSTGDTIDPNSLSDAVNAEDILKCVQHLKSLGVTESEMVEESRRWRQHSEAVVTNEQRSRPPDNESVKYFNYDETSLSSGYDSCNLRIDEVCGDEIQEDDVFDDSDCEDDEDDGELEESDDEAYSENPYYELKTSDTLQTLLNEQPDKFKRCIIHLDGPFRARCRMLDEGFRVSRVSETGKIQQPTSSDDENFDICHEVEIRGRANCGPCFDGDEVVVELKTTKELDGDKIIYRGTVVGILAKKIVRKQHRFLCRVDAYSAHLMKPLDGVAPKIHTVHSIIVKKYNERREELVAVYKMVDRELKLRKIIRLDPKKRRDMLFVVRYLSWLPGSHNMYPLGYVTKVLHAGEQLEDSQRVLNLLYQIPTHPKSACVDAASEIKSLVFDDDYIATADLDDIRTKLTITIDPDGCQDVDDALTLERLKSGEFIVGVHIADVGRFVGKDDVIDANACHRTTSFYSATKKVYPMLPSRLSDDLCSLREGQDRCVISVYLLTDKDLNVISTSDHNIKCSVIRNDKQMTYEEAQLLIDEARQRRILWEKDSCKSAVVYLHQIASRLRAQRLHEGRFHCSESDNPFMVVECDDAHHLVEEFMIRANCEIAEFLITYYPETLPVRRQKSPDDDEVNNWDKCCGDIASLSFYFRQFELLRGRFSKRGHDNPGDKSRNILILKSVLDDLEQAAKSNDFRKVKQLIGKETQHPLHVMALHNWFRIQECAEFACYADLQDEKDVARHFSLQVPHYVQFTSPIRRYMDVVIHRFVVAAINDEPSPYTCEEIRVICNRVNQVNKLNKKYQRACRLLQLTQYLSTPFFLPCLIEDFGDDDLTLDPFHLSYLKRSQRSIKYSHLALSDKPSISKDHSFLTLDWERRLYDTRPFIPHARSRHNVRHPVRIDTNRHTDEIEPSDWRQLLINTVRYDDVALRDTAVRLSEDAKQARQFRTEHLEVTSEMRNNDPIVRHHVRFSATFRPGSVVAVQYGAKCSEGYVQPVPLLINLTPELDLCIEHRCNAIRCFADLATDKVLQSYQSIEHYQKVWLPILAMEAVAKSTMSGESVTCNNVPISLVKRNDRYYGKLYLALEFCRKRSLKLFNNSKDAEEETNDYLCIRYHTGQDMVYETAEVKCQSVVRNVWTGHASAQYAHVDESKDVCVEFIIQHSNAPPPTQLLQAGKKNFGEKCTVEFLTKLLPDRRMEDAVKKIGESSDLCKRIVLGHSVSDLPGEILYPMSDTFDIDIDDDIMLNRNNANQTHAIRTALKDRFTLIQGPPGTGKTLTGIKLVYWYVHMNNQQAVAGCRRQVLYCGPSNSSVDVAAKLLKTRLGSQCPKIIRVYSEVLENQIFPIPRDSVHGGGNQKGRRFELIEKDEHHDVALHHLIRKKTNKFARRIQDFDKLFRDNLDTPENVSDEQVEQYQKLIGDACVHELQGYEVILCTCAASASPRMTRGANITQIIIDEAGMCMEPECLVPLATFPSAQQVVLIGDHKQLQPIVVDTVAKNLGLDNSLFERYKERAIMLTHQYRMHPEICEFPSRQFYDEKLVTAEDHECRGIRPPDCWPSFGRMRSPVIFCDIEGAEKSLSVSTADGNEQSKSNDAEREEAVRIFSRLVNFFDENYEEYLYRTKKRNFIRKNVDPNKITILSQYRAQCSAIEQDLKARGFEHPNVNTVIASQGDEWDYVILSLVRSMPQYEIEKSPSIGWCKRNMGFITDEHQINVALTRARLGLIIIGNQNLLRCNPMWRNLLRHCAARNCIVKSNQFLPSQARLEQQTSRYLDEQERSRRRPQQSARYHQQQHR